MYNNGLLVGRPVSASTASMELTQHHHVIRDVAPTNSLVLLYIKRGVGTIKYAINMTSRLFIYDCQCMWHYPYYIYIDNLF